MLWNDEWSILRSSNKQYEAKSACFHGFCMFLICFVDFCFPSNQWPQHHSDARLAARSARSAPDPAAASSCVCWKGGMASIRATLCSECIGVGVVQYDYTMYIYTYIMYHQQLIQSWCEERTSNDGRARGALGCSRFYFIRMMIHMLWLPSQNCQCLWLCFVGWDSNQ